MTNRNRKDRTGEFNTESPSPVKPGDNNNDIAVIGMAGRFPMADNLEEYWQNLLGGKDCIGGVPESRVKDWLPLMGENVRHLPPAGYLSSISQFDAQFFDILPGEAPYIDPAHRLLFETVYQAMEYAGYGGERMANTRTGAFIAFGNSGYKELISRESFSMTAEMGNLPAVSAGRISHMFGFRGPSLLIDTACSSSLTALHYACESIKRGECHLAVVGAINVYARHDRKSADMTPGLNSDSAKPGNNIKNRDKPGKSNNEVNTPLNDRFRVFDDSADGGVNGEGVGAILLKPLDQALTDGDIICAVIKGTAVNHNGNRTVTVSAQKPESQVEVMLQALENARISAETLSYLEASGTFTKMGDAIELRSIGEVFSTYTQQKQFCALGCVKANIGHLNHTSGMAALLKVILALQEKIIPPLANFKTPNSYLDINNSPVYFPIKPIPWELPTSQEQIRRAGISSFSVNGTNCHIIIEEAPLVKPGFPTKPPVREHYNILTISARNPLSLQELHGTLKQHLQKENNTDNFHDICYAMNVGRGHHEYSMAIVAKNEKEFIREMETIDFPGQGKGKKPRDFRAVFLFPGGRQILEKPDLCMDFYHKGFKAARYMDECRQFFNLEKHPRALVFAFQYALASLWRDLGIKPAVVLGFGIGKYVSQVISKELPLEKALEICVNKGDSPNFFHLDESKFTHYIDLLCSKGQRVFLEIGPGDRLAKISRETLGKKPGIYVLTSYDFENKEKTLLSHIAMLYTRGITMDFSTLFPGKMVWCPTYPFNRQLYWITGDLSYVPGPAVPGTGKNFQDAPVFNGPLIPRPPLGVEYAPPRSHFEKTFADILKGFLGFEQVGIHDNFYELGINSLTLLHINHLLTQKIQKEIPMIRMLEYPTIHSLGEYVRGLENEQEKSPRQEGQDSNKNIGLLYQSSKTLRNSVKKRNIQE